MKLVYLIKYFHYTKDYARDITRITSFNHHNPMR